MKSDKSTVEDYKRPVAYDATGRPLYAHPPKDQSNSSHTKSKTQIVHMTRVAEPEKIVISPAAKLKHDRSVAAYPNLNLSEGEYVIRDVRRHPIGLVPPLAISVFLLTLSLLMLFNYEPVFSSLQVSTASFSHFWITTIILVFISLVLLGTYAAYYIYVNNKFYLTNESVIQELQTGLFFRSEQTVSLMNIEDASYTQHGIIEHLFNYGSVRLSTEGDETTYRFSFVANPKDHIAVLNNAVEAFKNGRPIENDD